MNCAVYKYGLLPPVQGEELVLEQMRAAHKLYNKLIEIERARRTEVSALLSARSNVAKIDDEIVELQRQLDDERKDIKAERSKQRSKNVKNTAATRALCRSLKGARARRRLVVKEEMQDTASQAALGKIQESTNERIRLARHEFGVFWGTYLQIEQEAKQAAKTSKKEPPRFRRWDWEGNVSVQLQKGLSVADATSGKSKSFQLDLRLQPVPDRLSPERRAARDALRKKNGTLRPADQQGRHRPRVRLRVQSDESKNPVWAEWPILYPGEGEVPRKSQPRPLPAHAKIKWAKVTRRRILDKVFWELHVTVESQTLLTEERCGKGAVAVNLSWQQATVEDEGGVAALRIADLTDDRGEKGVLFLNRDIVDGMRVVRETQAVRDMSVDTVVQATGEHRGVRTRLVGLLKKMELPEEHAKRVEAIEKWRAPRRYHSLARWWSENRLKGDYQFYKELEKWRIVDRKLWFREAFGRRHVLAQRRDRYLNLAARLARQYDTLIIEELNLKALAAIPQPESEKEDNDKGRVQRALAAPSELRGALINAFRARGGTIITVPAATQAVDMLRAWREGRGAVKDAPAARSKRFQSLRDGKAKRAANAVAPAVGARKLAGKNAEMLVN